MNNRLVIIDAGHGGIDSGAVGNNLLEKDLNLQVSKYIYNRLKELGIPVVMTREEDIYLPKNERIKKVLELNNDKNALLISNHINAGSGEGAEVVYSLRNNPTLANLVLEKIGEKGQLKRKVYQRRLPENPNLDYYYILRESINTEPILIEYGFIDNKKDSEKLKNNLIDYGEGVVEAITTYLGYPYQESEAKEEYIVEKGDTLYSLSKRFNISIDELKRINNLSSDILSIGQVLKLTEETINNYDIYLVKKGDSLYNISRKYNIPVNELIKINNLSNLTLQINQELLVPKTNNDIYLVKKGDTLWSIAKNNNLTVEKLKKINNLTNNLLTIGQELKLK